MLELSKLEAGQLSTIPAGLLLSVQLSADYAGKKNVLCNVALDIGQGEIVGLVGQSGSGKSTLALAILGLLGQKGGTAQGEASFRQRDLLRTSQREMKKIRGREIGLVLQSPLSSLNPALRIGTQLTEAWKAHRKGTVEERDSDLTTLLESVSLPRDKHFMRRYPDQLSVGQAQRVLIALAIVHRPALLIADEPTSALDVITQAEILQLFAKLNRDLNMSILYISHDLLSVASLCHRVAILHRGEIVESGMTAKIFRNPQHPYTRRLIEALPKAPTG